MKTLRSLLPLLCLVPLAATADEALDEAFDTDVLIIVARDHVCYRFDVYLALSYEQHKRGLMFVRKLPPMTGMLFAYEEEAHHSMWMKNTLIPLDILFVKSDGSVSSIARNTEPQSLQSIRSTEPVSYVLELTAGTTERLAIDEDSRLIWESG